MHMNYYHFQSLWEIYVYNFSCTLATYVYSSLKYLFHSATSQDVKKSSCWTSACDGCIFSPAYKPTASKELYVSVYVCVYGRIVHGFVCTYIYVTRPAIINHVSAKIHQCFLSLFCYNLLSTITWQMFTTNAEFYVLSSVSYKNWYYIPNKRYYWKYIPV